MLPFFWHLREHSKNLSNTEDFLQIKHLIYATCCRGAYSKTCTIMQSNSPAKSGLFQRQCCSLCLGRGTIKGWGRFAPKAPQRAFFAPHSHTRSGLGWDPGSVGSIPSWLPNPACGKSNLPHSQPAPAQGQKVIVHKQRSKTSKREILTLA